MNKEKQQVFTKVDIYNMCYAEFLTGSLDDYSFPNNEVEYKYNELNKDSKEKLEKLIENTVKEFKCDFDYIEKVDTSSDLKDLHIAQNQLIQKICYNFSDFIKD